MSQDLGPCLLWIRRWTKIQIATTYKFLFVQRKLFIIIMFVQKFVKLCFFSFVSRNLTDSSQSNLAVMEVNLPSGFTADRDSLPSLEVSQNVQKVETSHELTKVILYFNNLTREEYCPTISAFRTHKVAKQKPVPVIIYDYYDSCMYFNLSIANKKYTYILTRYSLCKNEHQNIIHVS